MQLFNFFHWAIPKYSGKHCLEVKFSKNLLLLWLATVSIVIHHLWICFPHQVSDLNTLKKFEKKVWKKVIKLIFFPQQHIPFDIGNFHCIVTFSSNFNKISSFKQFIFVDYHYHIYLLPFRKHTEYGCSSIISKYSSESSLNFELFLILVTSGLPKHILHQIKVECQKKICLSQKTNKGFTISF